MFKQIATIPHFLSFTRIVLTPLIAFFIFLDGIYVLLALFTFTFAVVTDYFDGYLARKYDSRTKFGEFLDPLADKILVLTTFLSFYLIGTIELWPIILIILRDVFITSLRIKMLKQGHSLITSNFAKWKTTIQFIAIYIMLIILFFNSIVKINLPYFPTVLIYFVVTITIWTGISYLIKNKKSLKLIFIKK